MAAIRIVASVLSISCVAQGVAAFGTPALALRRLHQSPFGQTAEAAPKGALFRPAQRDRRAASALHLSAQDGSDAPRRKRDIAWQLVRDAVLGRKTGTRAALKAFIKTKLATPQGLQSQDTFEDSDAATHPSASSPIVAAAIGARPAHERLVSHGVQANAEKGQAEPLAEKAESTSTVLSQLQQLEQLEARERDLKQTLVDLGDPTVTTSTIRDETTRSSSSSSESAPTPGSAEWSPFYDASKQKKIAYSTVTMYAPKRSNMRRAAPRRIIISTRTIVGEDRPPRVVPGMAGELHMPAKRTNAGIDGKVV